MEHKETPPPSEVDLPLSGQCSCGAVRFEISEPILGAAACYCKRCQRRTGTGFSATGLTAIGSFSFTQGEENVKTYRPEDGWHKSFCSQCGGHVCTINPENSDLIAVRLGAVDGDPGVRIGLHQFTDYASPWFLPPDDGLPHFGERLDWTRLPAQD